MAVESPPGAVVRRLFLPAGEPRLPRMPQLTQRDLRQFSNAVRQLHTSRSAADFPQRLLHAMRSLVDADICVVDWVSPLALTRTAYDPPDAVPADVDAAVHRHLADNPLYGLRKLEPVAISDLLARRRWRATALYAEAYGRLGQEDGLGLDIPLGGGALISMVTTRGRRGYSNADRLKLALLGSHVHGLHDRLVAAAPRSAEADRLGALTLREREVLLQATGGMRNAAIAFALGVSAGTVKRHLENAYAKLGVHGRHQAAELLRGVSAQDRR